MYIQQRTLKWTPTDKNLSRIRGEKNSKEQFSYVNDDNNPNAWNGNLNNNNSNANWNNNVDNNNHPLFFQHFNFFDYISKHEFIAAYKKCRKYKRWKKSATKFEYKQEYNITILKQELEKGTYKISPSNVFVIKDPKWREICAAKFRDRIIHHLLISRLEPYFEQYFSPFTYNCIKNRGSFKALEQLQEYLNSDDYVIGIDVKSFFPSIPVEQTLYDLCRFVDIYDIKDKEFIKYLLTLILKNRLDNNYTLTGNLYYRKFVPNEKSIVGKVKGIPIGDLTSQYIANFVMTRIDQYLTNHGYKFVRFVDDLRIIIKKNEINTFKKNLFNYIEDQGLQFDKNKVYIQPCSKGCPFIGFFVTKNYILPGKRLKRNINKYIYEMNSNKLTYKQCFDKKNSYLGFLKFCKADKLIHKINQSFNNFCLNYEKNNKLD